MKKNRVRNKPLTRFPRYLIETRITNLAHLLRGSKWIKSFVVAKAEQSSVFAWLVRGVCLF